MFCEYSTASGQSLLPGGAIEHVVATSKSVRVVGVGTSTRSRRCRFATGDDSGSLTPCDRESSRVTPTGFPLLDGPSHVSFASAFVAALRTHGRESAVMRSSPARALGGLSLASAFTA